jgi:HrpA-like RNA helicase
MTLPTLLQNGFVVPPKGSTAREKALLKTVRGIDYIIDFISDRITVGGDVPKIRSRSLGDRVIVLKSQTGTGKSTVIPPFIYEAFQTRLKKNIAVTQPRVLTAIDISEGLPEHYPFLQLDKNLGYNTGDFKRLPVDKGIIYMTPGVMLQQIKVLNDDDFINKYGFILVDEVHVRDIDLDMVLYSLKKMLALNFDKPTCPMVILMSATFDEKIFMDYFNTPPENYIGIKGSTFAIKDHFLKFDTQNYIKKAVDMAINIHVTNEIDIRDGNKFRDIIIFVYGAEPIREIIAGLHVFNAGLASNHIAPIELSSKSFGLSGDEYQNLFSDINNINVPIFALANGKVSTTVTKRVRPTRRVIVSTNIAETGVTIDTLRYCIDTGYVNMAEFNPDFGALAILGMNVTRGMALQRKGRVGRKSEGMWFPCYTKETFELFETDQLADMRNSNITESLLSIIVKETDATIDRSEIKNITPDIINEHNLFRMHRTTDSNYYQRNTIKKLNTSSVDFVESPSASALNYSMEILHGLGFITNCCDPTILGMFAFQMRKISVESRRMILAGYAHGANVLDLITIAAFREAAKFRVFHRKYAPSFDTIMPYINKQSEKSAEFYYKVILGDEMIECVLIWHAFSAFLLKHPSIDAVHQWCIKHRIIYDGLMSVIGNRNELIENLISIGIDPYYNGMGLPRGDHNLLNMMKNIDDFTEEVRKLKHCILDGYRFNLCVWDNSSKKYILHHRNVPVYVRSNVTGRMGDDAIQTNPNIIVLNDIMVRKSLNNPGMYTFESSGHVSIMDTYVNVDLNLLKY